MAVTIQIVAKFFPSLSSLLSKHKDYTIRFSMDTIHFSTGTIRLLTAAIPRSPILDGILGKIKVRSQHSKHP